MTTANALYFPTIRVPSSQWFTRVLLYWDTVGTITPYDYVEQPERHEPYTLKLIQANLVTQVIPRWHVWRIPRFTEAFLEYLQNLGDVTLDKRKVKFRDRNGFKIHVEKLDQLASHLQRFHLARPFRGSWIEVESATAKEFMAYLAAALGRLEELSSIPLTDNRRSLQPFIKAGSAVDTRLETLRTEVLSNVLPAPDRSLDPDILSRFKEDHGPQLRRFRNRVEQKLVELAAIGDPALRERATELFVEEIEQEVGTIREVMASRGWIRTTLSRFLAVVVAIPEMSPLVGLASAVISAFGDYTTVPRDAPFLYALEVREVVAGH
jgi:hypothetical protein